VPTILVTIEYAVEPAKREAYLEHAHAMREHAREALSLDYQIHEDLDHPGLFTEIFRCGSLEEYEALDERQDDTFREMVARLDRFTDLARVRYKAIRQLG
jgi:quinol monooxygenase YgiN